MKKKICENCINMESYSDVLNIVKIGIGVCKKEGDDGFRMKENEFSVMCEHDGPIFVGRYFGCIHFCKK